MRIVGAIGAFSAAVAILTGAFAAHGLQDPKVIEWVKTAAYYQLIHSLALVMLLPLSSRLTRTSARFSAGLFIAGIALFSGSLYLLAATGIKTLGMITPIGGICMVLAWCVIGVSLCKANP